MITTEINYSATTVTERMNLFARIHKLYSHTTNVKSRAHYAVALDLLKCDDNFATDIHNRRAMRRVWTLVTKARRAE